MGRLCVELSSIRVVIEAAILAFGSPSRVAGIVLEEDPDELSDEELAPAEPEAATAEAAEAPQTQELEPEVEL